VDSRSPQHFGRDPSIRLVIHSRRHFEEWDVRDLWVDPDKQQQRHVDDQGDVNGPKVGGVSGGDGQVSGVSVRCSTPPEIRESQ